MDMTNVEVDDFNLKNVRVTSSFKIFWIHLLALIVKRLQFFKRDIRGLLCEIIIPCFVGNTIIFIYIIL